LLDVDVKVEVDLASSFFYSFGPGAASERGRF